MSQTKLTSGKLKYTPVIKDGFKECISPASKLFAIEFTTDPVIVYFLHHLTAEQRAAYLPRYFTALLTAAALNGATFTDADNYQSCTVIMPPGKKIDNWSTMIPAGIIGMAWNLGWGGMSRMLFEYQPLADALKKRALGGVKEYIYVFFTATSSAARGKGLCSSLLRSWQEKARKKKLPMYLESTTENSMRVYKSLGWEIVGEIVLGKGKVGRDGLKKKDGEGVTNWGMIWWPEGCKPEGN